MRGMVLIDMMVAMGLMSVMIILMGVFAQEAWEFALFSKRSQSLRLETYAIVQNVFPAIIREGVAIDYEHSDEQKLSLFVDKWTREDPVTLAWEQGEDFSRVVMERGDEHRVLTTASTWVTDLRFIYSDDPKEAEDVDRARAYQPMVSVFLATKWAEAELPRLAYESAYTLRNASLSTLP